jgi:hypothetical protein
VGTYFEENRLTDLVMSDFLENAPTVKLSTSVAFELPNLGLIKFFHFKKAQKSNFLIFELFFFKLKFSIFINDGFNAGYALKTFFFSKTWMDLKVSVQFLANFNKKVNLEEAFFMLNFRFD